MTVSSASIMSFCLHRMVKNFSVINTFTLIRHHWRYSNRLVEDSPVKYLLVLDFEATCEEIEKITQEIIEFPCLMVNAQTYKIERRFHEYVRPVILPHLSDFCIELTGILQEMVDDSDPFPLVYKRFEKWRAENNLNEKNSVYVTSGDWDLGRMLPSQFHLSNLDLPQQFKTWIDLKKLYARQTNEMPKSLIEMLRKCKLAFQGRQHSGIDDCMNIANILRYLGKDKQMDLRPTSMLRKSSNYLGYKVMNLETSR